MSFEHGFLKNHVKELLLLTRISNIDKLKKFKTEFLQAENYQDITFDVIKRGPLLLFTFGLLSASFCFIFQLIMFISSH